MELFSFSFVKPMAFRKVCDGSGDFYCDNTPKCSGTAESSTNIHHMLPTKLRRWKHGALALSTSWCQDFQDDSLQSSTCWMLFLKSSYSKCLFSQWHISYKCICYWGTLSYLRGLHSISLGNLIKSKY